MISAVSLLHLASSRFRLYRYLCCKIRCKIGVATMRKKLTDLAVERMKEPGETWDTLLPAFGIRVGKRVKVWQVAIRRRGEKHPARIKIGTYPAIGTGDARTRAREIMAGGAQGSPVSFLDLAEAFLEHGRSKKGRPLTKNTIAQYRRNLKRYALGLDHRPMRDVPRAEVSGLISRIARESGASTASLVRSMLSRIWSYAIEIGALDVNVVAGTPGYAVGTRSRVLSDAEIRELWGATADDGAYSLILRLCLWTGARRSEAGGMRWSELSDGVWTIPGSRTKNHRELALPLARQTIEALNRWPMVVGRDCLFGSRSERGFGDWAAAKSALDGRLRFNRTFVVHDLRRTVQTRLASLRISRDLTNQLLNHVIDPVTAAYDYHDYLPEKRESLQTWADELDRIVR
jgi:integrase